MHKYNKLFFSVLIFLAACKGAHTPNGVIKQGQMAALLSEIHIIDGSTYSIIQTPDTLYKYTTGKYNAVFKKYHTDSAQFRKSFKYYTTNPELLQTIYEQVSKNIKQKSDSLNKLNQQQIIKINKRRTDSLNKLPKKDQAPAVTPPHPIPPGANPRINHQIKRPKGHVIPEK